MFVRHPFMKIGLFEVVATIHFLLFAIMIDLGTVGKYTLLEKLNEGK